VRSFVIEYGGSIYHPIESIGREQARGFKDTTGLISDNGVFLSGNTFWYPRIGEAMMTFTLEVNLPQGWDAVARESGRSTASASMAPRRSGGRRNLRMRYTLSPTVSLSIPGPREASLPWSFFAHRMRSWQTNIWTRP
jgi:hypothetical protein